MEPRFDVGACRALGAHAYGQIGAPAVYACLGIPKACTVTLIVQQASLAGGLGARCAPSGEREGRSPLAYASDTSSINSREREEPSPLAVLERKRRCRSGHGAARSLSQWGARTRSPHPHTVQSIRRSNKRLTFRPGSSIIGYRKITGLTSLPKRLLACGSMVLPISSVVRFSLYERKTNNKKVKYHCEHHILQYQLRPVNQLKEE